MNGIEVSIVLPVYNEENIIENTVLEVEKILDSLKLSYEMILVDDGSEDDTWKKIDKIEKERRGGFSKEYYFRVILEKKQRFWQDWHIQKAMQL